MNLLGLALPLANKSLLRSKRLAVGRILRVLGRSALGVLQLTVGVLLVGWRRGAGRPQVAVQAYAVHLAYFYQTLIGQLLLDNRVEVYFLTWPHPHFPLSEQSRMRALAITEFGLDPSHVLPLWRAMWRKFDLVLTCDSLSLPLLRPTRTCRMFHGFLNPERALRRRFFRPTVYDYDVILASGPIDRNIILAHQDGRPKPSRVYSAGCPQLDRYFHQDEATREYLEKFRLQESEPVVLYAPHWFEFRPPGDAGLQLFLEIVEELRKLPAQIIVKPHRMSLILGKDSGQRWDRLLRQIECHQVRVDRCVEDVDALRAADVLITSNNSARAYIFMSLNKPVVFFPAARTPAGSPAEAVSGLLQQGAAVAESLSELGVHVREALQNPRGKAEHRRRVSEGFFANPGQSTQEVARILYQEILGLDAP